MDAALRELRDAIATTQHNKLEMSLKTWLMIRYGEDEPNLKLLHQAGRAAGYRVNGD